MRHMALVSRQGTTPSTAHTNEEIAKFISGALDLMGTAVGVLVSIEELRDLKAGVVSS